jgi:hypothetical protein
VPVHDATAEYIIISMEILHNSTKLYKSSFPMESSALRTMGAGRPVGRLGRPTSLFLQRAFQLKF